jgi:predicted MFS family arabinose efflux permease
MAVVSSDILRRRLVLVAVAVVAIPWLALALLCIVASPRYLEPEMARKEQAVGRILVAQVERAIMLGVPFTELRGTGEFLQDVLDENREINFVAILDSARHVLYFAHSAEGAESWLSRGTSAGRPSSTSTAVEELPIMAKGLQAGSLLIAWDRRAVGEVNGEARWDLLIALAVVVVFSAELIRLLLQGTVVGPIDLVAAMLERVRRGDFTAVTSQTASDEAGTALTAINRLIRHTDFRVSELRAHAEDVADAALDTAVADRVRGEVEQLGRRWSFAGQSLVILEAAWIVPPWRFVAFLLALADIMLLSVLPSYLRGLTGVNSLGGIVLVTAVLFSAVTLIRCPFVPLWRRIGLKWCVACGGVIALAALVLLGLVKEPVGMAVCAAVHGLGIVLVLYGCGEGRNPQLEDRQRMVRSMTGMLAGATVCGAAFGSILSGFFGYEMVLCGSFVAVALAALIAMAHATPLHIGEAAVRWPRARAADLLMLMTRRDTGVLIAGLIVPICALLTSYLFIVLPQAAAASDQSPTGLSRLLILFGASVVLGLTAGDRITAWSGRHEVVFVTATVAMALAALLVPLGSPGALAGSAMAIGVGFGASLRARQRMLARFAAEAGGQRIVSVARLAECLALSLGPAVVFSLGLSNLGNAMLLPALAGLVGAILYLAVRAVTVTAPAASDRFVDKGK